MTYWFAEHPFQTQTFTYSEELQRSDEIFLTDLIQSIKQTPQENFYETPQQKALSFLPLPFLLRKTQHHRHHRRARARI